ncbi:MAG: hypothetical protein WDO16_03910 [Bacteroidota bacterium]
MVILPVDGKMFRDYDNTKEAIGRSTGVLGITAAYETPEFVEWGDGIRATDEKGVHEVPLKAMPVDLNFTQTLKMTMVAGT